MKFTAMIAASAVFALSAPALAGDTPTPNAQDTTATAPTQPEKKPKEKKVCRSVEASSTSRISTKRICKTQAEWNSESNTRSAGATDETSRSSY